MLIQDYVHFDGHNVVATWLPAPSLPPVALTRQSSGICFYEDKVILVRDSRQRVMLPGGTIEAGETFEQTLIREVYEEACAIVQAYVYLGAQKFESKTHPTEKLIYQVRYWAKVQLLEFAPQFETAERLLIKPDEVARSLQWQTSNVLSAIITAALHEQGKRG